jgi:iron complex transport system ATP-binding protein
MEENNTPPPVLRTENLSIGYISGKRRESVVAAGLSLRLLKGEIVCLIGPNGAGKSTLIRSITGLQDPLGGDVFLEERNLRGYAANELARKVSIVTTERVNLGMFTGYSLTALGRYPYTGWRGVLSEEDTKAVRRAIENVGAGELAGRSVNEMSDGERQKIMIARALAQDADIMVLDEPTAFLDLPRRVEIMSLLHKLSRQTETAVLISTHDLDLALRTADRLWLISQEGELSGGAPEDCILSGAFERTFASGSVSFDKRHGSFHINTRKDITVMLRGGGLYAYWTRRGLEREGFLVEKMTESLQDNGAGITVVCREDPPAWEVLREGNTRNFHSIYDMITYLRCTLHGK